MASEIVDMPSVMGLINAEHLKGSMTEQLEVLLEDLFLRTRPNCKDAMPDTDNRGLFFCFQMKEQRPDGNYLVHECRLCDCPL